LRTRGRDTTDRVRRAFGNICCPVDRIDRDVELRRAGQPGAELFAFKNPGRFVFDSFAAAASAASLSPRPSQRNELSAAASVARTKSNSMIRSMSW